jgi:hypothetical protein
LRLRSLLLAIVAIASLIVINGALSGWPRSFAAELPWLVPDWLQAYVGEGEGQIAPVVLQRARALYLKKVSEGAVNNPCYFAMDATRPGGLGRRFYIICEADRFDGTGDTSNARPRAIGGHPGVIVSAVCRMKAQDNPYADDEGYVPFGKLIEYDAGRSNGCTTWYPADSEWILALVENKPTTLYIYPESTDIVAVARAVQAGQSPARAGLYWNASCLREIGFPNFWPKETLEPALMKYREDHPAPPQQPLPLCSEQYVRLGN